MTGIAHLCSWKKNLELTKLYVGNMMLKLSKLQQKLDCESPLINGHHCYMVIEYKVNTRCLFFYFKKCSIVFYLILLKFIIFTSVGDTTHKSHMQSIIDKLQTPQSFLQSVQELVIALQRTGDPGKLTALRTHLDLLSSLDPNPGTHSNIYWLFVTYSTYNLIR